jgi:hypothetical protein
MPLLRSLTLFPMSVAIKIPAPPGLKIPKLGGYILV